MKFVRALHCMLKMKALKCKPSVQFTYTLVSMFLSNCSNIISHRSSKVDTSTIDLQRSAHRSSIFEGRHIDHLSSKVDTSISKGRHFNLRKSTHRSSKVDTSIFEGRHIDHRSSIFEGQHIDHRSPKVDTLIFESRHINLRRLKMETLHQQPNVGPSIRHKILSTTALHGIIP